MAETSEPKKETVRIKLPPSEGSAANSNGGRRDTVRINLPSRTPNGLSASSQSLKPPGAPVLPGLGQPPKAPTFPVPSIAEPEPSPLHTPSIAESIVDPPLVPLPPPSLTQKAPPVAVHPASTPASGPKKETARIVTAPEPKPAKSTVKMSKTQPLIIGPEPIMEAAPIFVEPANSNKMIESIPAPLCWALVGVSALIFIIQVWTYFS